MRSFGFCSGLFVVVALPLACSSDPAEGDPTSGAGPGGGSSSTGTGAASSSTTGPGGGASSTTSSGSGGGGGVGASGGGGAAGEGGAGGEGGDGGSGGCGLTLCGSQCVDTQTSLQHCGGCDMPCPSGPQLEGFTSCEGSACVIDCFNGHEDCNGDVLDGCEVNLETDSANCGTCGYDCGNACIDFSCAVTTVVSMLDNPIEIALDDSDVFFSDGDGIRRVPKGGGAPVTLAPTSGAGSVSDIAVDATNVYWGDVMEAAVKSVPKAGGSPVVRGTGNVFQLKGVAVGNDTLYWTTGNGGEVFAVPLAGGAPVPLASNQQHTSVVALAGTTVVWSETDSMGGIWRLPAAAVMPELVVGGSQPAALAIASDVAYFVANGDLNSVPVAGGALTVLVPNVGSVIGEIATDGVHIYWIGNSQTQGQVTVMRAPVGGGSTKQLAGGLNTPARLALDDAHVYCTDVVQNNIKRVTK